MFSCHEDEKHNRTPGTVPARESETRELPEVHKGKNSDHGYPTIRTTAEETIKEMGTAKDPNIEPLRAWVYQHGKISDEDWQIISNYAKSLDSDKTIQLLLDLSLHDISSDRGMALLKATLENVGSGTRRTSAIKHAALDADPLHFADLLGFLDANGYKEDTETALAFLAKSDSVRSNNATTYYGALLKNPVISSNPLLALKVAEEFGSLIGQFNPSLEISIPPSISGSSQEMQKAYINHYYDNVFSRSGVLIDMKSIDVMNSSVPPEVLSQHMPSISHLDFLALGPQKSLEQFPAGQKPIEDLYLNEIFNQWLNFDSIAASKYLSAVPADDGRLKLLIPEIVRFSTDRGDRKLADEWQSHLPQ